jgi:ribonuclease VapC
MSKRSSPQLSNRNIVLDASAVLANILKEPGGESMELLFDSMEESEGIQVAISSVNWCEILTKLYRDNRAMTVQELTALLAGVELVAFDKETAVLAADYARMDPSLSLGDRACLALASRRKATAWTTDKRWAGLKLRVCA